MQRRHDLDNDDDLDRDLRAMYTRRRFLVAGAVAAVPLGAWWAIAQAAEPELNDIDMGAGRPPVDTTDPAPATSPTNPVGTAQPVSEVVTLGYDLAEGFVDPKVGLLQQRLIDTGFDPGPVDDYFGEATRRSVWAFEKLIVGTPREQATGVVTPELWDRLNAPVTISPRRTPGGRHLEVYLPEQVAVLFEGGQVRLASHISSGEGTEWCDEVTVDEDDGTQTKMGICGLSITPGGTYHFERQIEGWRNGKLGRLYKPIYFNFGIAIHGATNVPNYPASHGCVRFPMHIAEYLQEIIEIGDRVYVFDGVEQPETYGAQPMRFDWPDPDYTTTTTTTTTTSTTTSTTTPPTTTAPTVPATTPPTATAPPTTPSTAPPTTTAVATSTTSVPPG